MIRLSVFAVLFTLSTVSFGQAKQEKKNPLRFTLDQSKGTFISLTGSAQIWARYTELNPGSTINGESKTSGFDVSIRRARFGVYGKLTPKLSFNLKVGQNNLNYINGKNASIALLNAYIDYQIADFISIGGGKSAWTGLSRYAVPSSFNALGVDIPIFALPTIQISDHLLRKLSVFAHGAVAGFDYRVAFAKPFLVSYPDDHELSPEGYTSFDDASPKMQTSAYLKYQFLDRESQRSPFSKGTYLGTKRILSIGAGFMYQPDAMAFQDNNGTKQLTDMSHFAADVFLELPLFTGKGSSITFYGSYTNYNYGQGYIRNIGVNNSANGLDENASFNGTGNAFPAIGTGDVFFAQAGYTFPTKMNADQGKGRFQIYGSVQHANYERLKDVMNLYEGGFSYIFDKHSKITLGYQSRPIFDTVSGSLPEETMRKGMAVLQYQIKF